MRINLNKLTKKHFLFAGLFLTASFALMVSSPKLRMALDTQPGNILPDGGSSVFDASSIANGTGLTDNLLADGSGNYFTFLKYKNGSNVDWHFQKIDSTGARAWGDTGVLRETTSSAANLKGLSDGAGGFFYVYDNNDAQIRAGHIGADGSALFSAGFALATTGDCADGASQVSLGSYGNYYYDDGHAAATDNQIKNYTVNTMMSDGAGGFIAWWQGATGHYLCAQRVAADGTRDWGAGGIRVAAADGSTDVSLAKYRVVSDGTNGIIVILITSDIAARADHIVVKKIAGDGSLSWGANGVTFDPSMAYVNTAPGIFVDGSGGVFIGYSSNDGDLANEATKVVRLTSAGGGVAGCEEANIPLSRNFHAIMSDGNDGAIVMYTAHYDGTRPSSGYPFYPGNSLAALRINNNCAVHAGWDNLYDQGGAYTTGADIEGVGNARLVGSDRILFWYDNLSDNNPEAAALLNLEDGTSVWGNFLLGYFSSFNPGEPHNVYNSEKVDVFPSGDDFLFVHLSVSGIVISKLKMADGLLDNAFGSDKAAVIYEQPLNAKSSAAVSDGSNGVVVVWQMADKPYIQNVSSSGGMLWAGPPRVVTTDFTESANLTGGRIVSIGNGGSAVFWSVEKDINTSNNPDLPHNFTTYETRAQIFDAAGAVKGPAGGIVLNTGTGDDTIRFLDAASDGTYFYALVGDGQNFAYGGKFYIFKFDENGNSVWGPNGVMALSENFYMDITEEAISPDGAGGIFLATILYGDVYPGLSDRSVVEHVGGDGTVLWGETGVVVGNSGGTLYRLTTDGAGGIYVVWSDHSITGHTKISRVDAAGSIPAGFGADGLLVSDPDNSYTLASDGSGNAVVVYNAAVDDYGGNLMAKKYGPDGALLWGNGVYVGGDNGACCIERFRYSSTGGTDAITVVGYNWITSELFLQRLDQNGAPVWGTPHTAHLTAPLAGGEAVIPVDSTAGFFASGGVVKIATALGSETIFCSGKDDTNFTGCVNTPAAILGADVTQQSPLIIESGVESYDPQLISDGQGGVVAVYDVYNYGTGFEDTHMAYVDENGALTFGSPFVLVPESENASISRGDNVIAVGWHEDVPGRTPFDLTTPVYQRVQLLNLFSTAPVTTSHAPKDNPPGSGAPFMSMEPLATSAVYHFTNPGNADSFRLYDESTSERRLIAENPDPAATTITETDLSPNTTYFHRLVVSVGRGNVESSPSPEYPPFTTLLANFDSLAASYDPILKAVSFAGVGDFPNLKIGQSGLSFVIKSGDKIIFDSGFIQTASLSGLSAADIEPGETYTVTVTPRNKNNVLSPPKDFSVTVPKDNAGGHALIKLNKIAERIDVPVSANTPASTADYWETPVKTKEIKYTVTAANTGDGKAKNFIITDLIAAGLNFEVGSLAVVSDANDPNDIVNASFDPTTNVITASISELEPNESFAVSFVVTPAADAPSKVKNKARASWEE